MTTTPRFVYILQCADQTLYTGVTTDLQQRVHEHNFDKQGAKYTKARRPVRLVWSQEVTDRSTATKEEWRIKHLTRAQKLKLISDKSS